MATPGLELLFNAVKNQISCPNDSILCVLHWCLVSDGYTCVGLGEKGSQDAEETEMLPDGWNTTPGLYVLRYKSSQGVFILKVIAVDNVLLVHLWKENEEKVATMNIGVNDYSTADHTSYKKALKNVSELSSRFKKEVLGELKSSGPSAEASSSRDRAPQRSQDDDDPLRVPPRRNERSPPDWLDPDDPFSVGRGDIDPLGRGMGGMLFDPMRGGRGPRFGMDPSAGLPSRLPPGAVPPGARFDPFGPPGTHPGQRPGPDPDHMRPPDYDDMFM